MDFNSFAAESHYAAKASGEAHHAPVVEPVNGYTNLPNDSWGWYEAVMGMVLGAYPVISARARDYDCFSRHINFSLRFVDWHYFFDGAFNPTLLYNWLMVTFKLIFDVILGYNMLYQCKDQLDWGVFSGWAKKFGKNAAASENPVSDEFSSFMMKAESQVSDFAETKEGQWLHNILVSLDPEGTLFDEEAEAQAQATPVVGAAASTFVVPAYSQPIDGWRLAMQILILVEEIVKTVYFYSSNFYYYNLSKSFFKLISNLFVMIDHVAMTNVIVPTPAWNRYRTNGA